MSILKAFLFVINIIKGIIVFVFLYSVIVFLVNCLMKMLVMDRCKDSYKDRFYSYLY